MLYREFQTMELLNDTRNAHQNYFYVTYQSFTNNVTSVKLENAAN